MNNDEYAKGSLSKERYPNHDLFIADILDATPKDDMGSMEHPMFALKAGDKEIRRYEHNGNSIEITPSVKGLATIHDKDILIYCISQLIEAINRGEEVSRRVRVTAYDLMVTCNRDSGGRGYKELQEAFARLRGTTVRTNILSNGVRQKEWFGLIDSISVVEKSPDDERMMAVDLKLSEWLFNSVQAKEVLTLSRDYFRLRKPLERRLYELARKHCGAQPKWKIGLAKLHKKTGSKATLRKFRELIKRSAESQHLPDYRLVYQESDDSVTFFNRAPKGALKQIREVCSL